MFRPPPHHPHGGPPRNNGVYPQQQGQGMGGPNAFPGQGRGGRGFQPPFHGGPYRGFPASQGFPSSQGPPAFGRPPPPPASPPVEHPPPPPPTSDGSFRSGPKPAPPPPPPMPKDPEMLKNIEILCDFVVKNGPQFESMARAKQAGDPKFAFLFGGERGSDAQYGFDFYNWKKEHLMWVKERIRAPPADPRSLSVPTLQGKSGGSGVTEVSRDDPDSPAGSDMDMEDDFALPDPANDKDSGPEKTLLAASPAIERKHGPSPTSTDRRMGLSSPAPDWKPSFSSPTLEARPALPVSSSERKISLEAVESKTGIQPDRDLTQSGNRFAAETQRDKTLRPADVSRTQREKPSLDAPRRRDTRRRTGFDRPCMEDISTPGSPVRTYQQKESVPPIEPKRKGTSGNGHRDFVAKPSRWGPEPSSEFLGSGGSRKPDTFTPRKGESSFSNDRDHSPDIATKPLKAPDDRSFKDNDKPKPKPKPASDLPPAVDEFGRLLQQGGSDSDADDNQYDGRKKRRRTSSRSRSRSPGDTRFKYWSPDQSPHGRGRRSRSWSSPRRNKSRSITPTRDGRWGGEGRGDRSGRRGGWGGGGPPPTCYDFIKGKCFRGSNCRFSHDTNPAGTGDHGGRWSGGRGRGREQGYHGRGGEESERNWGGRIGDDSRNDTRNWRHRESEERTMEEPREAKSMAEKRQEYGASVKESLKEDKYRSDNTSESPEEMGRTGNQQQAVSSSETGTKAFSKAPSILQSQSSISPVSISHAGLQTSVTGAPPTLQSQSSIPPGSISQAGPQQQSVTLGSLGSQQQSAFSSVSTSEPHMLGSLISPISHPSSRDASPTPHTQQLQFSSGLSHLPQSAFLTSSQLQIPGHPPLPSLSQINTFTSSALHQQFNPARNVLSSTTPPLASLASLLPPFSVNRSHPAFNSTQQALQQPNFSQFPNSSGSSNQFLPHMGSAQPQMLRSSMFQTTYPMPTLTWIPGPHPNNHPLVPPPPIQKLPLPLQQPPPPLQQPPQPSQSLQQPSQALQPLHQPSQQPLPSQLSTALSGVYPYGLPSTYSIHSYSTLASNVVPTQPRPGVQDQYDPLSDSLEPEAPAGQQEQNGLVSTDQNTSQGNSARQLETEQWRHSSGGMSAPLMTNAGEVVLENVSPGLPGHGENFTRGSGMIRMPSPVQQQQPQMVTENVRMASPVKQPQTDMENVSPTDRDNSLNVKASVNFGALQHTAPMENVSPPDRKPKEDDEYGKESKASKMIEEKRKEKEGRVLNLIRKAVAEHVKDALKPAWKGGQISKEDFKTIAKKAVDKVMQALELKGQIPKTQEKVDAFMKTSRPKIAKLVQGYVDKYAR